MVSESLSRRERLRRQTVDEIREHALAQVTAGGPTAVSLSEIARSMGMSAPAIYRYFESRDELLETLVTAGYADLTAALERAERKAADASAEERLKAVATAYRDWGRANPRYYGMLFGVRPGELSDSDEAIQTIHSAMVVVLKVLGELAAGTKESTGEGGLDSDLSDWSERRGTGTEATPAVLRLGLLTWTRLHGIVSLELAGVFAAMEIDPAPLAEGEIADIAAAAANAT